MEHHLDLQALSELQKEIADTLVESNDYQSSGYVVAALGGWDTTGYSNGDAELHRTVYVESPEGGDSILGSFGVYFGERGTSFDYSALVCGDAAEAVPDDVIKALDAKLKAFFKN